MEEIYKRLAQFIINKGFAKTSGEPNVSAFEADLGISNDTIGKAFRQGQVFKIDVFSKIFEKHPDFDSNYIFTGVERKETKPSREIEVLTGYGFPEYAELLNQRDRARDLLEDRNEKVIQYLEEIRVLESKLKNENK